MSLPQQQATPQVQPAQTGRLLDLVAYEYHSLAVRRLDVTDQCRGLPWLAATACSHPGAASEESCTTCIAWADYLIAALSDEDIPRLHPFSQDAEQVHLWVGLERISSGQRDLELVRLDFDALHPGSTPAKSAPQGDDNDVY